MKNNSIPWGSLSFIVLAVVFIAAIIVLGPFIQIWCVNTLFNTGIEYSWLNWFAMLLLTTSIRSVSYNRK